jgi:hypothetical protein
MDVFFPLSFPRPILLQSAGWAPQHFKHCLIWFAKLSLYGWF